MFQIQAVTFPENDRMDPHGANPTLSISLPNLTLAMQGLEATVS